MGANLREGNAGDARVVASLGSSALRRDWLDFVLICRLGITIDGSSSLEISSMADDSIDTLDAADIGGLISDLELLAA